MAKILIVDDHPLVRTGLAQMIGDCPDLEVCGEAGNMVEALGQIDALKPDLAIIDLSLAGGSGLELIERIRRLDEDILMLVASMHDETLYAERVLAAGARGFVNKQEAQDRIIRAIRQVLGGKIYLSERMTERLLSGTANNDSRLRNIDSLSNRELQVFELIGQGVSTADIASRLNLSIKTIETHQAHIKKKLGLESAHQLHQRAIRWVMGEDS